MKSFDEDNIAFNEAYDKALKLLDYSAQTGNMLYSKLIKKGYSKKIIERVLKRLENNNLLNDIEYSSIYAENLFKLRLMGRQRIREKLRLKGITENDAKNIIENLIDDENEYEIAVKFINKNHPAIMRLIGKNQREKVRLKLINNGFSIKVISKIIDDLDDILRNKKNN